MPALAATAETDIRRNTSAEAMSQTETTELVRAVVARTRLAQGLPAKVEDTAALAALASVLTR